MALNSRQRRARRFNLALRLVAKDRNPATVAVEGRVRSTASKRQLILPAPRAFHANGKQKASDTTWEGSGKRGRVVKGKLTPIVSAPKIVSAEWKDAQAREARLARDTDEHRLSRGKEMQRHKDDLNALSVAPPLRK